MEFPTNFPTNPFEIARFGGDLQEQVQFYQLRHTSITAHGTVAERERTEAAVLDLQQPVRMVEWPCETREAHWLKIGKGREH